MKEVFLKVDQVEPMLRGGGICSRMTYMEGVKVWIGNDGHLFPCDQYTVCDPDVVREEGRRQVVELIKELAKMKFTDKNELFDYCSAYDIISHFSYDEIVEKLDAWKKERNAIHVRDEVANINNGTKFIVTVPPHMSSNSVEYMSGIGKDGKVYKDVVAAAYKKTGVRVDSIDTYLEV